MNTEGEAGGGSNEGVRGRCKEFQCDEFAKVKLSEGIQLDAICERNSKDSSSANYSSILPI